MEATVSRRILLTLFLCVGAATSAPQDASSITYVRPLPEALDVGAPARDARDSKIENLPLIIGGSDEVKDGPEELSSTSPARYTRDSTTSSELDTTTTEAAEAGEAAEAADPTEPTEVQPREPSPRYVSKLSYFNKANQFGSALNFVERTGKRKFRSRCRCEKIWNCPKLQITVPRCPDEYFLCCF